MLLDKNTRVLVHGVLARYAQAQLKTMRLVGTNIVAGVSVGAGGTSLDTIPIFDSVAAAVDATRPNAALLFVPAAAFLDALTETLNAGIKLVVAVAEHVPVHDALKGVALARRHGAWLVGPNTVGMVVPGVCMLGSFSLDFVRPGSVAVMSRSGSLTSNTLRQVYMAGYGQSVGIHMGGDYVCGRNPGEYLEMLERDERTKLIVYVGEVGGTKEYDLIERLPAITKPVVAMIVGRAAPPEKRLGHAGALVLSDRDTAQSKLRALGDAGVRTARNLVEIGEHCRAILG